MSIKDYLMSIDFKEDVEERRAREKKDRDMRIDQDNKRRARMNLGTMIEDGRIDRICVGMSKYYIKNIYNEDVEFKKPRIILVKRNHTERRW